MAKPPTTYVLPAHFDSLHGVDPFPETKKAWNYLNGIRTDNLLDGLVGGNNCNAHTGGGWSNAFTGLGTFGRDKVMQGSFSEPFRIDDPQLSALFNGNDLAQRIVMDRPLEMFRRGWCLVIQPDADAPKNSRQTSGAGEQPAGGESGPAAPGAPLIDPMGAAPDNASPQQPDQLAGTETNPTKPSGTGVPHGTNVASPTPAVSPHGQQHAVSDPMGEKVMQAATHGEPSPNGGAGNPKPADGTGATGNTQAGILPGGPLGTGAGTPPADVTTPIKPGTDKKNVDPAQDQGQGAQIALNVEAYGEKLGLKPRFIEGSVFGRLYGGGLLIVGADDGQDMSTPLQEDKIKTIRYLSWIDRRFIYASTWYSEIGPKYGEVETWEIVNPFGGQTNTRVHETRVIRFDGTPVDFLMRRRLMGWTLSVLQAPYDVMRQFDQSYQSISNLMADVSQAVMKIQGLAQMISQDQRTLQTRMQLVDISRSAARMLYVDAEHEDFERTATPMTGISDVMQMQMLRVSSAAKEPVALLFGREPSGLNATGDADFRRFYNVIAGEQKAELEPKLRRMHSLICLAKDGPTGGKLPQQGLSYTWHKLYEPSEKEQSEIRWNMAQADNAYITNKALLPEEVAMSRFRSGELHLDTEIDLDKRKESLETAELAPSGAEAAQQEHDQQMALATAKGAAGPGKGPPGAKPAAKPLAQRGDAWDSARYDSPAEDVYDQMSDDFPPEAIDWVPDQPWRGPTKVPLDQIDYSNRKKWHASKPSEHGRVDQFAKLLEEGSQVKPIVIVQPPSGKAIIVDGHHRALAHRWAGHGKALVYVAKVKQRVGPWDETHAMQRSGPSGASGASGEDDH